MLSLKELTIQAIVTDKTLFAQTSWKEAKNVSLPFGIADKLMKCLDEEECGISESHLDFFNKKASLKNISIHGNRIKHLSSLYFLKNPHLETISIEQMRSIKVNTWIREINGDKLEKISFKRCLFKTRERKFSLSNLKSHIVLKPLRNIKVLDVSSTNFDNYYLKLTSRELHLLEELNISKTNVDSLESIKNLTQITSLDISYVTKSRIILTYSFLYALKSLIYLNVSQNDVNNNQSDVWREFFDKANWPQLLHFNTSGRWKIDGKLLKKFLGRHLNLEFLGLVNTENTGINWQEVTTNHPKATSIIIIPFFSHENLKKLLEYDKRVKINILFEFIPCWLSKLHEMSHNANSMDDFEKNQLIDILILILDEEKYLFLNLQENITQDSIKIYNRTCALIQSLDTGNLSLKIRRKLFNICFTVFTQSLDNEVLNRTNRLMLRMNYETMNENYKRYELLIKTFERCRSIEDISDSHFLLNQLLSNIQIEKISDKEVITMEEYFLKFLSNIDQLWKEVGDHDILDVKNDIEKLFNVKQTFETNWMYTLKELSFQVIVENRDDFFHEDSMLLKVPPAIVDDLIFYLNREEIGINPFYINFFIKNKVIFRKVKINGYRIRYESDLLFLNNPDLETLDMECLRFHRFHNILSLIKSSNLKELVLVNFGIFNEEFPIDLNEININWKAFKNLLILKIDSLSGYSNLLLILSNELKNLEELSLGNFNGNFNLLEKFVKLKSIQIKDSNFDQNFQTIFCIRNLKLLERIMIPFSIGNTCQQDSFLNTVTWPNLKYFQSVCIQTDCVIEFISHPKLRFFAFNCFRPVPLNLDNIISALAPQLVIKQDNEELSTEKLKKMLKNFDGNDIKYALPPLRERDLFSLNQWERYKYAEIIVDVIHERSSKLNFADEEFRRYFYIALKHFIELSSIYYNFRLTDMVFRVCLSGFLLDSNIASTNEILLETLINHFKFFKTIDMMYGIRYLKLAIQSLSLEEFSIDELILFKKSSFEYITYLNFVDRDNILNAYKLPFESFIRTEIEKELTQRQRNVKSEREKKTLVERASSTDCIETLKELCYQKVVFNRHTIFKEGNRVIDLPSPIIDELIILINDKEVGIRPFYLNSHLRNAKNIQINGHRIKNDSNLSFLSNPNLETCIINDLKYHNLSYILSLIKSEHLKKLSLSELEGSKVNLKTGDIFPKIEWKIFQNLQVLKVCYHDSNHYFLENLCIELKNLEELDFECFNENIYPIKRLTKLKRFRLSNISHSHINNSICSFGNLELLEYFEINVNERAKRLDSKVENFLKSISWPNLQYFNYLPLNKVNYINEICDFVHRHPKLQFLVVNIERSSPYYPYRDETNLEEKLSMLSKNLIIVNNYYGLTMHNFKKMFAIMKEEEVKNYILLNENLLYGSCFLHYSNDERFLTLNCWEREKYFEILVEMMNRDKHSTRQRIGYLHFYRLLFTFNQYKSYCHSVKLKNRLIRMTCDVILLELSCSAKDDQTFDIFDKYISPFRMMTAIEAEDCLVALKTHSYTAHLQIIKFLSVLLFNCIDISKFSLEVLMKLKTQFAESFEIRNRRLNRIHRSNDNTEDSCLIYLFLKYFKSEIELKRQKKLTVMPCEDVKLPKRKFQTLKKLFTDFRKFFS
ncbi:DgyrCDS8598 [Dimorphilus gyrociliatus]|uniref:DgyrCDS8598 n=1 Tax=Dimorphilus gyrociliatus TaxID=2664684 RepID=A0A7I8VWB3_9ANNE|nr:DgyrCDS8598 [Dimorphilus gyrociliatus]